MHNKSLADSNELRESPRGLSNRQSIGQVQERKLFRIDHHLIPSPGQVLPQLASLCNLSDQEIQFLFELGSIYKNGKRLFANDFAQAGDEIRVHCEPRRFAVDHVDWLGTLFHIDPDFYIVNKPANIPVHPTLDNAVENVLSQIGKRSKETLHITQRLDHGTRGLFLVARNKRYQAIFNGFLRNRETRKFYRALTNEAPPTGRHVHFMEDSRREPRRVFADPFEGGLTCELEVSNVRWVPHIKGYVSEIQLFTGRTHQIRAQLSALGFPLLGDPTYGGSERVSALGLQCFRLEFPENYVFELKPSDFIENAPEFLADRH